MGGYITQNFLSTLSSCIFLLCVYLPTFFLSFWTEVSKLSSRYIGEVNFLLN